MGRPYEGHYLTEDKKKIVEDNMNFLWYYYKKYVSRRYSNLSDVEREEIVAALHWGICLAAEAYDPEKGKFSSICKWHFKSAISNYFRERSLFNDRYILIPFTYDRNDDDDFKSSENFSIVKKGGAVSREDIEFNTNRVKWDDLSFLFDNIELDAIEKDIVLYNIKFGYECREVGDMLGYSGERIRQLRKGIIKKLKNHIEKNDIKIDDFIDIK